jgi:hypothetical protein
MVTRASVENRLRGVAVISFLRNEAAGPYGVITSFVAAASLSSLLGAVAVIGSGAHLISLLALPAVAIIAITVSKRNHRWRQELKQRSG